MNRRQEYEAQLARDDERVVNELLNNPEWGWLKEFYQKHWDNVCQVLNGDNLRTVVEDYGHMEPTLASNLVVNLLFVYQVNLAIYHGAMTKERFSY